MRRLTSGVASSLLRGALAVALGVSLILGSLILGSLGAGSSASAEEPVSVSGGARFYGYVFTSSPGALPEYVRAIGPTGASCGTADVARVSDYVGSYALPVYASEQKRGCPAPGGVVQFLLLSGRVDDGVWAAQVATLGDGGESRPLHLQVAMGVVGNWLGQSGDIGGDVWLRWSGPSTSLASGVASIPLPVATVYYLDRVSGVFVEAMSRPDAVLSAGDLVMVRFR